jgi:hypothetical protein
MTAPLRCFTPNRGLIPHSSYAINRRPVRAQPFVVLALSAVIASCASPETGYDDYVEDNARAFERRKGPTGCARKLVAATGLRIPGRLMRSHAVTRPRGFEPLTFGPVGLAWVRSSALGLFLERLWRRRVRWGSLGFCGGCCPFVAHCMATPRFQVPDTRRASSATSARVSLMGARAATRCNSATSAGGGSGRDRAGGMSRRCSAVVPRTVARSRTFATRTRVVVPRCHALTVFLSRPEA